MSTNIKSFILETSIPNKNITDLLLTVKEIDTTRVDIIVSNIVEIKNTIMTSLYNEKTGVKPDPYSIYKVTKKLVGYSIKNRNELEDWISKNW
jgi:hypothetical protein